MKRVVFGAIIYTLSMSDVSGCAVPVFSREIGQHTSMSDMSGCATPLYVNKVEKYKKQAVDVISEYLGENGKACKDLQRWFKDLQNAGDAEVIIPNTLEKAVENLQNAKGARTVVGAIYDCCDAMDDISFSGDYKDARYECLKCNKAWLERHAAVVAFKNYAARSDPFKKFKEKNPCSSDREKKKAQALKQALEEKNDWVKNATYVYENDVANFQKFKENVSDIFEIKKHNRDAKEQLPLIFDAAIARMVHEGRFEEAKQKVQEAQDVLGSERFDSKRVERWLSRINKKEKNQPAELFYNEAPSFELGLLFADN